MVRLKFIAATFLLAHALLHPALHGLLPTQTSETLVRELSPGSEQSRAESRLACLGCRVERRLEPAPLVAILPAPSREWELLFIGALPNRLASQTYPHLSRAPPSF